MVTCVHCHVRSIRLATCYVEFLMALTDESLIKVFLGNWCKFEVSVRRKKKSMGLVSHKEKFKVLCAIIPRQIVKHLD
ncbi:hypothetical protein EUGRSUZ_D02010 [Eucalyptus grandis]|uniref:Uncharacterized protein n=2 Tax=Eucalyptus grandis TaxID=71139 RepID=A0ACC3L8V2_EUCGR|nr:hypothetical protein EUGRSUZ_D02010 [Eucalyptus grandis]